MFVGEQTFVSSRHMFKLSTAALKSFRPGREVSTAFEVVRCPSNFAFQRAALMPPWVAEQLARLRIPLIADTHSSLIADSVPGDRGHLG
jgi:hypothetical protein